MGNKNRKIEGSSHYCLTAFLKHAIFGRAKAGNLLIAKLWYVLKVLYCTRGHIQHFHFAFTIILAHPGNAYRETLVSAIWWSWYNRLVW